MNSINDFLSKFIGITSPFLDGLEQPIAIIDSNGRYVYYNKESAALDGCTQDFALNKLITDVYPYLLPETSTMLQSLRNGTIFNHHHQNYFNAKGQLVNYTHTTAQIRDFDGNIAGAIEIGWDETVNQKLQNEILELNRKLRKLSSSNNESPDKTAEEKIITKNGEMIRLIDMAKKFAKSNVPVMILGESGTGKELFAELVYQNSSRANKPFVAVNCGAITKTLIESSLFGTVKGAFTGAENKDGFLAIADGGTLFLDEFNSMPMSMQVKLLRYLQTKTYSRVGDYRVLRSDARIIVAMNEHPDTLIKEGRLRQDLYWRLNVAQTAIPPLRDRTEDIPILADFFIKKYADSINYKINGISDSALGQLNSTWPGNVRMLENAILRSMLIQDHDGPLEKIDAEFEQNIPEKEITQKIKEQIYSKPAIAVQEIGNISFEECMNKYEQKLIVSALNTCKGNISKTAEYLKINRTTLNYKIKKHNIVFGVLSSD